jgi:hypothetical protein
MWLNYQKKINLVQRLAGDRKNHFFFITNRIEHVQFLADFSQSAGFNTLFFDRSEQFSLRWTTKDVKEIVDGRVPGLGAKNFLNAEDYLKSDSKIFITPFNNSLKDKYYLKNLASSQEDFLTFSPADTNSLFTSTFIPLFGNNDSLKSLYFYLNIFVRHSVSKPISVSKRATNLKT